MNSTLEKWLFFLGVILFLWFLTPELDARASETVGIYHVSNNGLDIVVTHTVDSSGLVHTFSCEGYSRDIVVTLDDTYKYLVCAQFQNSSSFGFFVAACSNDFELNYNRPTGMSSEYWYFDDYPGSGVGSYGEFRYLSGASSISSFIGSDSLYAKQLGYDSFSVPVGSIFYSNYDIYSYDGILVFQRPLPSPTPTPSPQQRFLTAVEMTNLEAVMIQVVGLAPLLIGLLTTLFGFSKGLRLLFQTLRQA